MVGDHWIAAKEGTPQGGPLSPLMANLLLNDVDKELEKRGLKFVRYADDCNIYESSKRAGERILLRQWEFGTALLYLRIEACTPQVAVVDKTPTFQYKLNNKLPHQTVTTISNFGK